VPDVPGRIRIGGIIAREHGQHSCRVGDRPRQRIWVRE
jgi:hypothetical protein